MAGAVGVEAGVGVVGVGVVRVGVVGVGVVGCGGWWECMVGVLGVGGRLGGGLKRRSGEGVLRRVSIYKDLPEASGEGAV